MANISQIKVNNNGVEKTYDLADIEARQYIDRTGFFSVEATNWADEITAPKTLGVLNTGYGLFYGRGFSGLTQRHFTGSLNHFKIIKAYHLSSDPVVPNSIQNKPLDVSFGWDAIFSSIQYSSIGRNDTNSFAFEALAIPRTTTDYLASEGAYKAHILWFGWKS